MTEFTETQEKRLGELFPDPPGTKPEDTLLAKLTTLIRDAILAAPKLVKVIEEVVDNRVRLIFETRDNEAPTTLQRQVEEIIRNLKGTTTSAVIPTVNKDEFYKGLTEWLRNHPDDCERLQHLLYETGRSNAAKADQVRLASLQEVIFGFYKTRQPDSELKAKDVSNLANTAEKEKVIHGKKHELHAVTVKDWIENREAKMTEILGPLTRTNTPKSEIENCARLFVLKGIGLDAITVKEAGKTSVIAEYLKKQ